MASQPKTTVTQQNDAQISVKEVYTLLDPLEPFQFIRGKYFKFEFLKQKCRRQRCRHNSLFSNNHYHFDCFLFGPAAVF